MKRQFEKISAVDAVDSRTLRITFGSLDPDFIVKFGQTHVLITPSFHTEEEFRAQPIGTGPFKWDSFQAGVEPPDGPGRAIVGIEDLFAFSDRYHGFRLAEGPARDPALAALRDDAGAVLRELGVTHVLLVDRRPGDGVAPLLVDVGASLDGSPRPRPVQVTDTPAFVVNPSGVGSPPREALLPTDMDFALTAIWSVRRPGPYLELRALR